MNEVALPDVSNLSEERLSQIKLILQPKPSSLSDSREKATKSNSIPQTNARQEKPSKSKSVSPEPAGSSRSEKYKLAHHILSSSTTIIGTWKSKNTNDNTQHSHSIIYEAASISLKTLYEVRDEQSRKQFNTEKRHLSFILKLLDVDMVNESIAELKLLIPHVYYALDNTKTKPTLASILSLSAYKSLVDESIANLVVLTQIALLKACSKCPAGTPKPVQSQSIINSVNASTGLLYWVSKLSANVGPGKLVLFGKLFFALSNTSSIPTCFHYRLTALLFIQPASYEPVFINLFLASYSSLRKKAKYSVQQIVSTHGSDILKLVTQSSSAVLAKNETFVIWFESFYQSLASLSKNEPIPNFQDWESAHLNFTKSLSDSDPLLSNLQTLKLQSNVTAQELGEVLMVLDTKYLSNPLFHTLLLELAKNMIGSLQFSNFVVILQFYQKSLSLDILDVSRGFNKLVNAFFVEVKNIQSSDNADSISYTELIDVYNCLAETFSSTDSTSHLVYVSNSLLSIGAKLRQKENPVYIDYWRKSVAIAFELHSKNVSVLSTLPPKVERLCISLIETDCFQEAFDVASKTFSVILKNNNDDNEIKEEQSQAISISLGWESSDFAKRLFNISSRVLLDGYPNVEPRLLGLDTENNTEIEAAVLEQLITYISKSTRNCRNELLVKIMKRMEELYTNNPLKLLKTCNLFFRATGLSYDDFHKGIVKSLLERITKEEATVEQRLGSDIELQDHQYYIISSACFFASAFSDIPTTIQYQRLSQAVSYFVQALNQGAHSDTFIEISNLVKAISAYLNLQGAHEKRAELLKAVVDSALFKSKDPNVVNFLFHCKINLISSLIYMGYTGTALNDINALISDFADELRNEEAVVKKAANKKRHNTKPVVLKPIDKAWLKLRHIESLIFVGETTKASSEFEGLFAFIQNVEILKTPLLEGRPASEDRDHFRQRALLFAEICNTLASFHIEQGNVEYGISQSQKAIHFLQGFLKKFQSDAQTSYMGREIVWQLTSSLISSQTQIAMAYERLGIIRETCYFTEEAIKAAQTTECRLRLAAILAFDAEVRARMGNYEKCAESLQQCQQLIKELNLQDLNVLYYAHSAILSLQRQNMFKEETEYYALSDQIFSDLKEKSHMFSINEIADEIQRLSLITENSINNARSLFSPNRQSEGPRHSLSGPPVKQQLDQNNVSFLKLKEQASRQSYPFLSSGNQSFSFSSDLKNRRQSFGRSQSAGPSEILGLEVVWNSIVRSWAHSLGLQNSIEGAITLLENRHKKGGLRDSILFDIVQARNYYLLACKLFSKTKNFSFLADSVVSVPSIVPNKSFFETYMGNENFPQEAVLNLEKALQLIVGNASQILAVCNATEINNIANLINSIEVYIAAIKPLSVDNNHVQSQIPYPNLVFQEIARRLTLESDRAVVRMRDSDYNWPNPADHSPKGSFTSTGSSRSASPVLENHERDITAISQNFHNDLLVNIPQKWAVVTVSVCTETGNLDLCRFEKNKTPFQLNLPLNRHNSRDANENPFSFDYGIQKLREIINASNDSASVKRTSLIKTSEERHKWWKERYDLDKKLEELLKNAEYFWLGGFTGIFSNKCIVPHLFQQLSIQFVQILRAHLPSRNWVMGGSGRRKLKFNRLGSVESVFRQNTVDQGRGQTQLEAIEIEIEPRVLELFVKLGPIDQMKDPGMLEDLVYFVLDILSFHGERNAYDEIDVDQMMINIEDVLKAYHTQAESYFAQQQKAWTEEQTGPIGFTQLDPSKEIEHIVLVLDKKSQSFPWESIPCLREQSVTRVPSLTTLSELLERHYDPSIDPVWPVLPVSPSKSMCSYILNPGRDLPKTQMRFEPKFSRLPGWTGLIGKVPQEKEMASMLSKSDILVYMGHGSGQQYIRAAKIKSLKQCCPTLLLGCSSGVLTEAGDYEPWGTPSTYMVAGCPMLMANMWDVTDKDIDIFSTSMLERWGVLPPRNPGMKELAVGEAMTKSRDDCNLKYLNGAAPVVYGIPLILHKSEFISI